MDVKMSYRGSPSVSLLLNSNPMHKKVTIEKTRRELYSI